MTNLLLDQSPNERHLTERSASALDFLTHTNPDGTRAYTQPIGRDMFANSFDSVSDLAPQPGVNGFTLVMWYGTDVGNNNPGTNFPDYRVIQMGDDAVDGSGAAQVAWAVDNDASQSRFGFYVPGQGSAGITLDLGMHMYAWVVDCASGPAPILGYKDGVLAVTGGTVSTSIDTSVFRTPAFALGAHQGGTSKTLDRPGANTRFGPISIFKRALTAPELLTAYGVMTS